MEKLKTQKGKKDSKVKAEAEKIYRKYLQRGAVYEINLGPDVKRQIDKDIQGMAQRFSSQSLAEFDGQNRRTKSTDENFEPSEEKVINPMLFEKAQTEIFLLMNRDPFLRFQRTLKENSRIN